MTSIKVSNINVIDLSPSVKDPALAKFISKNLKPERIEFTLGGVNNAIANGIRRTAACELPVKHMICNYEDIKTRDKFIIPEMIIKRLMMIPLSQSCDGSAVFEIDVANNTAAPMDIKTSLVKAVSGYRGKTLPFNETFTLLTLNPGKTLNIKNIRIETHYGFESGFGMCTMAHNASSVSVDQQPINMYDPGAGGIPSRMSNPKVYRISMNSNGAMPARDIIKRTCDNLIERVNIVKDLLSSIEVNADEYVLIIKGESDTIGNLFMRTITDLFPDIRAVTYLISNFSREATIRVRCDEDINTIFSTSIKHIVRVYTSIRDSL